MSARSIRDVAAHAGVSVGTVSNVLNHPERVSEAVRARVEAAVAALGYVRNDAARQLRAGRSRAVGLIVLDGHNPFFTDLARGARAAAARAGLAVLLGDSEEDPAREELYLDLFEEQRVRGLLVSPLGAPPARLDRMRRNGTPVVLVDRSGAGTPFSSVSVDDVAGGRLAAEHLRAAGRRRLGFVGGPTALPQVRDRLAGARAVGPLQAVPTAALTVAEGRRAGEALLARGDLPDGLFAANDLVALGLLQALTVAGVDVPGRVALVGYDDIDYAASAIVALTSVRQPSAELGAAAVELLDAAEPTHRVFTPTLTVRASA